MNTFTLLSCIAMALADPGAVTGTVVGADGQPVASAQVYLEAGLSGTVVETSTDAAGRFAFEGAPAGMVGVFAKAEGSAYGGDTLTLTTSDDPDPLTIRLGSPGAISGRVTDQQGKPVSGARITRVALVSTQKVSIPLAKLTRFDRPAPVSDTDGRFTVPDLPVGAEAAIKVSHADFAQEGLSGISVGDGDVRVTLQPGVLLQGRVLGRKSRNPVANAAVLIRSDAPPRDTTVAATDVHGEFLVRLEPGVYGYQAAGSALRSPGWEPLTVTGQTPQQTVELLVSGTGSLEGEVRDAVTRDPIAGARLLLTSHGNPAAITRTGADGVYVFEAAEGDNTVTLQEAPGYQQPQQPVQRVSVAEGQTADLQTFWLAPVPGYSIVIQDSAGTPIPGALATVLRPAQLGRRQADAEGCVRLVLAQTPEDGIVLGVAEHPTQGLAAPFHLRSGAEAGIVRLTPYGRARGVVTDGRGRPAPGITVAAAFSEAPGGEPFYLWLTVTDADGAFRWDYCASGVGLRCVAYDEAGHSGASPAFHVEASGEHDLGRIVVQHAERGTSSLGRRPDWDLEDSPLAHGVAVVICAETSDAPAVAEALSAMVSTLGTPGLSAGVLVEGSAPSTTMGVPTVSGERPGVATTYVLADGIVTLETAGLPPVAAIRAAAQSRGSHPRP